MRGVCDMHFSSRIYLCALCLVLSLIAGPSWADFTFVQISDTHVGTDQPAFNARFRKVIEEINALKPDFVIHTGDALTKMTPDNVQLFKDLCKSLTVPLYVVPGNHDIENIRDASISDGEAAVEKWTRDFGKHITIEKEDCLFIGLNSCLYNSRLPSDVNQLAWLKTTFARTQGKRIFIFQHHPLFIEKPTDPNGDYFAVDEPMRSTLLSYFRANKVKAVLTGHVHRFLESSFFGIDFISTPAVSFSTARDEGLTGYRVFHVYKDGFTHTFVDLRQKGSPPNF